MSLCECFRQFFELPRIEIYLFCICYERIIFHPPVELLLTVKTTQANLFEFCGNLVGFATIRTLVNFHRVAVTLSSHWKLSVNFKNVRFIIQILSVWGSIFFFFWGKEHVAKLTTRFCSLFPYFREKLFLIRNMAP